LRDEMRAIRFALEYAKAELALRDWAIRSTIIVFGGARVPSPEQAAAAAQTARSAVENTTAERLKAQSKYYEVARESVASLRKWEEQLDPAMAGATM
jgi:predicted Rossmann-fold nucleotide-binding protein